MKPFSVAILTPEKIVYKGDAVSLTVPGIVGFFGIWANHMSFISTLASGKVVMKKNESESPVVFHMEQAGGILEVSKNQVTLLTEGIDIQS